MSEYDIALQIATKAHKGQEDKNGVDYIQHPLAVSALCNSPRAKIAALLHDVVEDTDITLDDLRVAGIGEDVVEAVDCLTKRVLGCACFNQVESLDNYLERVASNDIAVEVKFADMRHNSDMTRWLADKQDEAKKNFDKYAQREKMLTEIIKKRG